LAGKTVYPAYLGQVSVIDAFDLVKIPIHLWHTRPELDEVAAADALPVRGAESARRALHEGGAEGVDDVACALCVQLDHVLAAQTGKGAAETFAPNKFVSLERKDIMKRSAQFK
jgi:hypothetical protein